MHDLNTKSHAFKERETFKQILTIHSFCECLNNVSIQFLMGKTDNSLNLTVLLQGSVTM